jgi:hypothetical protein
MTSKLERLLDVTQRRSTGPGGKQSGKTARKDLRKKAAAPYHKEGQKPFQGRAQHGNNDQAGPPRNQFGGQEKGENNFQAKKKDSSDTYTKGANRGGKNFSRLK